MAARDPESKPPEGLEPSGGLTRPLLNLGESRFQEKVLRGLGGIFAIGQAMGFRPLALFKGDLRALGLPGLSGHFHFSL